MKIELELNEGQVKELVRFFEQATNGAFMQYCKKVESGGIEILFDASLQTEPARAMSNHVQSFTAMSLQYHSGYFHLKKQPVRLMPWLSLRGDSPSSKIVSYISRSLLANRALSPVRNS
jgi:hypothetical protein